MMDTTKTVRWTRWLPHPSRAIAALAAVILVGLLLTWQGFETAAGIATLLSFILALVAFPMARRRGHSSSPTTHPPPTWPRPLLSPTFFGRETELGQLSHLLKHHGTVVICGPPGVGKTQVALAFAKLHEETGGTVFWVRGKHAQQIAEDLRSISPRLGLSAEDSPSLAHVYGWLERNSQWLIVIDDLEDEMALEAYALPSTGNVLITSRSSLANAYPSISLENWTDDRAVDFILTRTGGDEVESADLADRLLCNPLLIDHATRFIIETGTSPANYLRDLEQRAGASTLVGSASPEQDALHESVELALERAEQAAPGAAELFHSLSALSDSYGIPRALILKVLALNRRRFRLRKRPFRRTNSLDAMLLSLAHLGLLIGREERVFIHDHVSATAFALSGPRSRSYVLYEAAAALVSLLEEDEQSDREKVVALMGHAFVVAERAQALTPQSWPGIWNWSLWMARLYSAISLSYIARLLLESDEVHLARSPAFKSLELASEAYPYAMGFYPPEAMPALRATAFAASAASEVADREGDVDTALLILDEALKRLKYKRWNLWMARFPLELNRAVMCLETGRMAECLASLASIRENRAYKRFVETHPFRQDVEAVALRLNEDAQN